MPITSYQLDYCRLQRNGLYRCRGSLVDNTGQYFVFGPFWSLSEANALQTVADYSMSIDMLDILKDSEVNEAIVAVNNAGSFTAWPSEKWVNNIDYEGYRSILAKTITTDMIGITNAIEELSIQDLALLLNRTNQEASDYKTISSSIKTGILSKEQAVAIARSKGQ